MNTGISKFYKRMFILESPSQYAVQIKDGNLEVSRGNYFRPALWNISIVRKTSIARLPLRRMTIKLRRMKSGVQRSGKNWMSLLQFCDFVYSLLDVVRFYTSWDHFSLQLRLFCSSSVCMALHYFGLELLGSYSSSFTSYQTTILATVATVYIHTRHLSLVSVSILLLFWKLVYLF